MEVNILRHGVILIMAVFDTEDNGRTAYTEKTLAGFLKTVNFNRHTLFISDNGSCQATHDVYEKFTRQFKEKFPEKNLIICYNGKNLGTAKGVNKGIQIRSRSQKVIKADNDIYVHDHNWVEQMEEALDRDHLIGIIALKRTQVSQYTWTDNPDYRITLRMLPHLRDQRHINVEDTSEVIGTCTMFSERLLNRIGGTMNVPNSPYGFDDSLNSLRCRLAGFKNCYLSHIVIDHLDNGAGQYVQDKITHATDILEQFKEVVDDFKTGVRDVFIDPFD